VCGRNDDDVGVRQPVGDDAVDGNDENVPPPPTVLDRFRNGLIWMRRAHAFLSSDDLSSAGDTGYGSSIPVEASGPNRQAAPGMSHGEPVSYGVMTRAAGHPCAARHDEAARPLPFSVACL
jgi:hypothetical protein